MKIGGTTFQMYLARVQSQGTNGVGLILKRGSQTFEPEARSPWSVNTNPSLMSGESPRGGVYPRGDMTCSNLILRPDLLKVLV